MGISISGMIMRSDMCAGYICTLYGNRAACFEEILADHGAL